MELTQPIETVREFEFVTPVKRNQKCKSLITLEDLNIDVKTGKGTCETCSNA
jgi:hypothetical protein